jgi:aflatoxin B1 aldehyde reductase
LKICARRGFICPTVYEGPYNLIDRAFETAIIPLLRTNGIRLAAHSPLAGGYLTGKLLPTTASARMDTSEPGPNTLSHFDPAWPVSSYYTKRYLPMGPALAELQTVVKTQGLTLQEVAYRWLQWHSAMVPEDHGLVIGASTLAQLRSTIADWCVCVTESVIP